MSNGFYFLSNCGTKPSVKWPRIYLWKYPTLANAMTKAHEIADHSDSTLKNRVFYFFDPKNALQIRSLIRRLRCNYLYSSQTEYNASLVSE